MLFLNTIYSMVYLQYWQIIRIMIKILIILDLVLKVLKTDSLDRNSLFLAQWLHAVSSHWPCPQYFLYRRSLSPSKWWRVMFCVHYWCWCWLCQDRRQLYSARWTTQTTPDVFPHESSLNLKVVLFNSVSATASTVYVWT